MLSLSTIATTNDTIEYFTHPFIFYPFISTMDSVALLHSHHLLDHKPDNLLLKGGKYKLRGIACLGRPGVALCVGPPAAMENFQASLEAAMPQKRFELHVLSPIQNNAALEQIQGFEPASLGDLRILLAFLGHEDEFFALTGLDPSQATNTKATTNNNNNQKGSKKKKGKK